MVCTQDWYIPADLCYSDHVLIFASTDEAYLLAQMIQGDQRESETSTSVSSDGKACVEIEVSADTNKIWPGPGQSPAERALGVVELLETVLLLLPMRDVLLAQGVNSSWKAIIDHSPRLQRKLFFQSKPWPRHGIINKTSVAKNEMFKEFWVQILPELSWDKHHRIHLSPQGFSKREGAFAYPKASWRNMFLTQPAVKEVELWGGPGKFERSFLPIRIANKNGVQLKDIVELSS